MVILVSYKNEEDPIKIEGARMATIQNIDFSNTKANSTVRGQIWPKFELVRDIIVILVTCKNEEDPLKNKDARVATTQNIDFSNTQRQITAVRGRIWSKFELIRDVMDVLVTSKNKEDPNKNEGARVATTLNINFSHSQGQITAVKGRIWLKFELI